jgi:hypothetical protein
MANTPVLIIPAHWPIQLADELGAERVFMDLFPFKDALVVTVLWPDGERRMKEFDPPFSRSEVDGFYRMVFSHFQRRFKATDPDVEAEREMLVQ